jgi:GNAT superfamily N-acetyltransferase
LVRLSRDYDLATFDCGDPELNEFVVEDALSYQEQFLANTTLMLCDGVVAAYFSLAADAIQLDLDEKQAAEIDVPFASFPALKICRLATDLRYQGRTCGTQALEFCVGLARHLNDEHRHDGVACRFVTVDAYPKSVEWYLNRDFIRNGRAGKKRETISLRLDVMPYED